MPPEETANPTIDQAFEAAEQSLAQEPTEKTVEQPAEGDTKAGEKTQTAEQPPVETPPVETTETDELLTKDEVAKLSPEGQANYKKMQKAYTQKTQTLAAERKKLENWQNVIDAFEADPVGTLRKIAPQYGLQFAEAAAKEAEETTQDPNAEVTAQMQTELRELLGPEQEALADGLTKIFDRALRSATQSAVKAEVEPLKQRDQERALEEITTTTETEMKAFGDKHKDWKQHEPKMLEIGKKLLPAEGMTTADYLETLYYLATKDQSEAEQVNKVVERINKAASSAEPQESAVNTTRVTPARPKRPTLEEAFEAAEKGIAW